MNKPKNVTENDWKLLKAKYKNLNRIVKKIENTYSEEYNKLKEMNIDTKLHFGPTLRRKRD